MMLVVATATISAAHATFMSDMWWKPDESGWGANVVQQEEISFITVFVYNVSGEPIWYVAPNARQIALTASGLPVLYGKLYRTRGPWLSGVFDPTKVAIAAEGHIIIEAINSSDASFQYQIDGLVVNKRVTRQTWKTVTSFPAVFDYFAAMHLIKRTPNDVQTSITMSGSFTADIDRGVARFTYRATDKECIYTGAITQTGKFSSVNGIFGCNNGEIGGVVFNELEINRHGFTSQVTLTEGTTISSGTIAGAKRR